MNKGRKMGRQAERMPMLHSTLIQTPSLVPDQVASESFSCAMKGMRMMPAMQTL